MTSAILIVAVFVVLMLCRFAFAVLHSRPLLRDIAAPYQRCKSASELGLLMLEQPCADVIAENPFGAFSDRIYLIGGSSRAEKYLNYIVALTGATQTNNHYALDVGKTRFYLGDRYVRRQRDSKNPEYGYDETCFYSAYEGMPRAEEIATVLLQLKSNPALFDQWASQNALAYKADGHVFGRAQ